jgi:hypothetical protein
VTKNLIDAKTERFHPLHTMLSLIRSDELLLLADCSLSLRAAIDPKAAWYGRQKSVETDEGLRL